MHASMTHHKPLSLVHEQSLLLSLFFWGILAELGLGVVNAPNEFLPKYASI